MLSAGSCVEWLRDDMGLIASANESATVAAQCESAGDVWFVPALLGLGTPVWDFGARGTLVGLTRGSGKPEVVRAVLEGVAHRGADLVEASEEDSGYPIAALRVDGGMSANPVFVQALADAIGRPVEISPVQTFSPRVRVEPTNDDLGAPPFANAGWRRGARPRPPFPISRVCPSSP
jgi:glycerol kinase